MNFFGPETTMYGKIEGLDAANGLWLMDILGSSYILLRHQPGAIHLTQGAYFCRGSSSSNTRQRQRRSSFRTSGSPYGYTKGTTNMAYQVGEFQVTESEERRALTSGRHDEMKDLRCMSLTSKGTAEIIAAGWQDTMLVVDLNKGEVTKQVSSMRLTVGIFPNEY